MKAYIAAALLAVTPALVNAAEPDLYQNNKLKQTSQEQVRSDIMSCKTAANESGYGAKRGQVARSGVRTAAKGAAAGALGGAIMGENVGRATGAGAAIGGTAGTVRSARERGENNPEFQKFVTVCLEDKGYKVIGWKK